MSQITSDSATPRKPSSSRVKTTSAEIALAPIPQSDLKTRMKEEIGHHAWQVEPDIIAKMLSPKHRKPSEGPAASLDSKPYPSINDFACLIDEYAVVAALNELDDLRPVKLHKDDEEKNYPDIARFLNACITQCDKAYVKIHDAMGTNGLFKVAPKGERWWPVFSFNKYNKQVRERIDHAASLKPDIVGITAQSSAYRGKDLVCYWSRKEVVEVAGEVKANWSGLVAQAATYARAQGSAIPLRAFSVVIGVNHVDCTLRFLIFHRGGLTASTPLPLTTSAGRVAVRKVMMSILLWQTPQDAGIPPFTDGFSFVIPSISENSVVANVNRVFYHALSIRGRNTWVARVERCRVPLPASQRTPDKQRGEADEPPSPARTVRRSKRLVQLHRKGTSKAPPRLPRSVAPSVPEVPTDTGTFSLAQIKTRRFYPTQARPVFVKPYRVLPTQYASLNFDLDQRARAAIVKCSWPTKTKREVEPQSYVACSGQFGTPTHLQSFEACYEEGFPISSSIFLPETASTKDRWAIWNASKATIVPSPDLRSLWVTMIADEGQTLENCRDAPDLSQCILHAMLGWLVIYQNDRLHRDVSIGNILKLVKSKTCKPFTTRDVVKLLEHSAKVPKAPDDDSGLSAGLASVDLNEQTTGDDFWMGLEARLKQTGVDEPDVMELVNNAHRLEVALDEMNVSTTECVAILSDCDMAAVISTYFEDRPHGGDISGTPEFMSRGLRDALDGNLSYQQSPVDDMHSFFWVTLWAILHREDNTSVEKRMRKRIEGSLGERELVAIAELRKIPRQPDEYGPMLRSMAPFLMAWHSSLNQLADEYDDAIGKCVDPREKRLLFHRFAYRGVLDFVTLFRNFKSSIDTVSSSSPPPTKT